MNTNQSFRSATTTTLYIVRHGESLDNAGIPYEQTPLGSSLTERGRAQAHDVARRLAHVHADAVISSNLTRARQTAEIIALDRDLEVIIIPELHERDTGSFAGRENVRDLPEYRARFEEYERGTEAEKMRWKLAEEWESLEEARIRFTRAIDQIVELFRGKTVIVVAHGTVMRSFLIHAGYGTLDQLREGAVDNVGYVVVQTDGDTWTVVDAVGVHRTETPQLSGNREE